MKRTPIIFTIIGLSLALTGILFVTLQRPTNQNTAFAALPVDHPPVSVSGGARVNSTLRDFFQPGTQPSSAFTEGSNGEIDSPNTCTGCHSGLEQSVNQPADYAPWEGWQGSMMAHSGRDPIFYAALDIANADASFAGEFCLRCHMPAGWLQGHSTPPDGSAMTANDREGVQCEVCHRVVNPTYVPGQSPARDQTVLAQITATVPTGASGNTMIVVDPEDYRRGPFNTPADLGLDPHKALGAQDTLQSAYHTQSAFCGSCHDISNPLLSWDESQGEYVLNTNNQPFTDTTKMFPIERTYSEWRFSSYNTPQGVYAPQFGGNKSNVSTCQDCHMRSVSGVAGSFFGNTVNRTNMPIHDLTGANTWVPQILTEHPVFSDVFKNNQGQPNERAAALAMGIERARYMLQNAATLVSHFDRDTHELTVRITNQSGHKLPTGYIEGRRMWLQIEGYDAMGNLVYTSGAYNANTGVLTQDSDLQVYEAIHVVTGTVAAAAGIPPGEAFHFVLNNHIQKDNRIPPRGYTCANYTAIGAEPRLNGEVRCDLYADGQYWDEVTYTLPSGVEYGRIRLLHQVASKEYVEFLRDSNPNAAAAGDNGEILYDLWINNGRSTPEVMEETVFGQELFLPLIRKP